LLTGQIDVENTDRNIESTVTCKRHMQEMTECYMYCRERESWR